MSEPEGTAFAGHRIEEVIGRGGMGVVYRATQLDLDRTVALKVIAADLLDDEEARQRFVQESRLAASIDHPHVIPIHAAGEQDGVPYLVMQYVAGDDARSLARRDGPLAPARAARIVAQVGERWTPPTRPASCTATSSPQTCCSRPATTPTCPTSA